MDIILASQSPRRRELLGQMGLKGFKVTSPDVDEMVDGNLPPAQMCRLRQLAVRLRGFLLHLLHKLWIFQ